MGLFDLLKYGKSQNPPRLAGGAHQPGEQLCADLRYMNEREAATISGMVETWRSMEPHEYEAALRSLNS